MRNSKLCLLDPLAGIWRTEGKKFNGDIFCGTDSYEWMDGGFFMIHHADILFGNERVQSVEIILYDELDDVFRSQSYDNQGEISISTLTIDRQYISILSDQVRFAGRLSENTIKGIWEKFDGQSWEKWMNIELNKSAHAVQEFNKITAGNRPITTQQ